MQNENRRPLFKITNNFKTARAWWHTKLGLFQEGVLYNCSVSQMPEAGTGDRGMGLSGWVGLEHSGL